MVLSFFVQVPVQGRGQPVLTRHMRATVSSGQAVWVGRLPATQSLRLNIALPLRNESELDRVLQQIYDPRSSSYRKFLSVEEFTGRFGPSQEDYDAVIGFAEANGLTVTGTSPNRMIVDVQGPVANIEGAFHVNMGGYQHPTEDRTFYAPDREPTADLPVALWHITGLDNFSIPRPASLRRAREAKRDATGGSGPGGSFYGSDMRAAYYGVTGPTALTGSGQSVGLVEFSSYNINDVTTYFSNVGQPLNVPITTVPTDGSSSSSWSCTAATCGDAEPEVALDIIEPISMAPGLSQVLVYVAVSSDADIFAAMANDGNTVKLLSCSWGWEPADPSSDEPYFKTFAAQGQSLFVASGDGGSIPSISWPYYYPAEDAYVTSVGGTDLTTNGAGGPWESETAWSDSGGGIAQDISTGDFDIPTWQQTPGVITAANKGSTQYRNIPDVAAEANLDNYICYSGNAGGEGPGQHCEGGWGGTSFAAPRWAGYIALVNQQSVANGASTVGFINPAIYTIGLGSSYGADFHDITSGNNGAYSAEVGYDLVTGWGSPNGTGLINSLCGSITRYMLWAGPGGSASIWTLNGSNNFTTYNQYGPYSGWTPVSYSSNSDGTRSLLWAGTGGYASIWTLNGSNNYTGSQVYGPYIGWTPVSYSSNSDGTRTLLWARTGGYAAIWTLNSSNSYITSTVYGPYSGWTPVRYSSNSDGTRTLLWAGTGGYASIWTLNSSNNYTTSTVYGPYSGWTPVRYSSNSDGTRTLLWAGTGGYAAIWTLNGSNNFTTYNQYGPYSGWTPVSYSSNSDGTRTLLWAGTGGYAAIWTLNGSNNFTTYNQYGPYSGWAPIQYQPE
jgi:kumamolisin